MTPNDWVTAAVSPLPDRASLPGLPFARCNMEVGERSWHALFVRGFRACLSSGLARQGAVQLLSGRDRGGADIADQRRRHCKRKAGGRLAVASRV